MAVSPEEQGQDCEDCCQIESSEKLPHQGDLGADVRESAGSARRLGKYRGWGPGSPQGLCAPLTDPA